MSEWKPGDVAMVRSVNCPREIPDEVRMLDLRGGWQGSRGYLVTDDAIPLHRVAVIDPEDADQVERLYDLLAKNAMTDPGALISTVASFPRSQVQDALRKFAEPKQPKPDEPTGLGAVVVDSCGVLWTRIGTVWVSACVMWKADEALMREYADIAAVRILSPGITPTNQESTS